MATTPPSSDPQATQTDTVIVGSVNQVVLQQANPTVARAYTSDFVAEKNEIIATQVKQLEATQGFPVTDAQLTGITVSADAPARFIVNSKYQDEIEAANAAQSVPADTPPPTNAPADINAPTPAAEFSGGKRFAPEAVDEFGPPPNDADPNFIPRPTPVVPATNQQVPSQPDSFSEEGIDFPVAPPSTVDPQIPQPDSFPEEGIDFPVAPAAGVDPQISQPDSFPEEGIDFPVAPPSTVDPQIPQPDSFPEEGIDFPAPVAPAVNPEVPQPTLIQNLFTSTAVPVTPVTNSQVPQAPIQNIFDLIASLFSRTPAVAPAVNPQVAQAIPVPTPAAIVAVPIPPAANPQVTQVFTVPAPTVTTATPIPPVADPQIPQPDSFPEEGIDLPQAPPANVDPQIPQPDSFPEEGIDFPASPSAGVDPQVPQPPAPGPTAESVVNQVNPAAAQDRYALKLQIEREVQPQIARELQEQNPTWSPSRVFTTSQLRASAQADAAVDLRLDQEITAASLNPPTVSPESDSQVPAATDTVVNVGGKRADPDIVDSPAEPAVQAQAETKIDGPVNQTTFQQADPAAATDYRSYVVDTQNKIVEQQTRELEATQGFPASENQIAAINGAAFGTATVAADIKFKDQIQAADAAPSVPVDTPPPTVAPTAVDDFGPPPNDADPNFISKPGPVDNNIEPQAAQVSDAVAATQAVDPNFIPNPAPVNSAIDPEVPSSANTRVENVFQSELAQKDPALYQQWQGTFATRTEQNIAKEIAATEAVYGRPVTPEEKESIANFAAIQARNETNAIYQDELQAANAVSVVPTDTPPPTETAPAVDSATNQQVPPPSTSEALIDPDTGEVLGYVDTATGETTDAPPAVSAATNPQVPAAQDLGSEPPIDLPQAPPSTVDPQIPQPDSFPEEGIDFPVAPAAGVDPQIPQPDSFPEEGIDLPAPVESPTPYERFLAEENAATDAAQAAATARFNAQFADGGDIIGSPDDPQVNQGDVTDVGEFQAEPPPIPDIDTGYEDFYGIDEVNNVGEFQAEPEVTDFSGYDEFYGDDTGEFQDLSLEPEPVADNNSGYDEFYGDDTGEFQDLSFEPAAGDGESAGYDEFYGDDTGEFQDLSLEPDVVDSDDTGFSDFSDTGGGDGGDFFGGLFGGVKRSAGAVSGGTDPLAGILDGLFGDGPTKPNPKTTLSPAQLAANRQKAAKALAKQQNIINQQRKQANDGDWRVRLRLAGSANYLYQAPNPGILAPLSKSGSDGVIFPYTPAITTAYQAKYNAYELTHSNYKGYFYQGSSVGDISINATFTAQDTQEANYLLAVIHFFRSVTKMFYGQDDSAQRGAPPPLVFLQGLGEYQFNLHPCVVTNFNYTLPADVDYIRALSPNNDGTNLSNRRSLQSGVTPFINPSVSRLSNAGLPQGGLYTPAAPPTLGTNSPTYVPTKMDIQLTLLAIQTRSQVSKQFSLKEFANGNLIKGGFW